MKCTLTKAIVAVTKLTLKISLVLFIALDTSLASEGHGQIKSVKEAKISLHLQDARLKEVFREIEKKTDYTFNFSEDKIDLSQRITLAFENTTVENVLLRISGEKGLWFTQVNF